jgi:hypothetical protein
MKINSLVFLAETAASEAPGSRVRVVPNKYLEEVRMRLAYGRSTRITR